MAAVVVECCIATTTADGVALNLVFEEEEIDGCGYCGAVAATTNLSDGGVGTAFYITIAEIAYGAMTPVFETAIAIVTDRGVTAVFDLTVASDISDGGVGAAFYLAAGLDVTDGRVSTVFNHTVGADVTERRASAGCNLHVQRSPFLLQCFLACDALLALFLGTLSSSFRALFFFFFPLENLIFRD